MGSFSTAAVCFLIALTIYTFKMIVVCLLVDPDTEGHYNIKNELGEFSSIAWVLIGLMLVTNLSVYIAATIIIDRDFALHVCTYFSLTTIVVEAFVITRSAFITSGIITFFTTLIIFYEETPHAL